MIAQHWYSDQVYSAAWCRVSAAKQRTCLKGGLYELHFGPQAGDTAPLQPRQTPQGVSDGHPLHMYWVQPVSIQQDCISYKINAAHGLYSSVDAQVGLATNATE